MGLLLQKHRFMAQFGQISGFITGFGIRAKDENSVDHAADITHLSHNRIGALLENFRVGHDFLQIFSFQAFRPTTGSEVRGFLISCAIRLATSAQAACALRPIATRLHHRR